VPADAPLLRTAGLQAWTDGLKLTPGHGAFALDLGADSETGLEARARVAVGLTSWLDAGAEAFAQENQGTTDVGAIAGLWGRF